MRLFILTRAIPRRSGAVSAHTNNSARVEESRSAKPASKKARLLKGAQKGVEMEKCVPTGSSKKRSGPKKKRTLVCRVPCGSAAQTETYNARAPRRKVHTDAFFLPFPPSPPRGLSAGRRRCLMHGAFYAFARVKKGVIKHPARGGDTSAAASTPRHLL